MSETAPLEYPFRDPPAPGTTLEVAPGVHWLRMPLPFQLEHINLWLLEDGAGTDAGWTIVDCGIADELTRGLWERHFAATLRARPVRRVIVTHFHPDHAGNAAWLCERLGAELWMTQAEYLTAHAVRNGIAGYTQQATLGLFRANGLDEVRQKAMATRGNVYVRHVPDFPLSFRRYMDGERIALGSQRWRAMTGYGHAPEHASLYCEQNKVLISGDMLLPRISTNVSVWAVDPLGNPLKLFLDSIERYRLLPSDTLVLPSHGLPFRGAHARVAELEAHHRDRLGELEAACNEGPRSANDLVEVLFKRKLDVHQLFFALGETIAHLHYLRYAGRLERHMGADGVARFARAAQPLRAIA